WAFLVQQHRIGRKKHRRPVKENLAEPACQKAIYREKSNNDIGALFGDDLIYLKAKIADSVHLADRGVGPERLRCGDEMSVVRSDAANPIFIGGGKSEARRNRADRLQGAQDPIAGGPRLPVQEFATHDSGLNSAYVVGPSLLLPRPQQVSGAWLGSLSGVA